MIIVDSNIFSAVMGVRIDETARAWLFEQPVASLYLTAITVFELEIGFATAPVGRKRDQLIADYRHIRERGCNPRVLELDDRASRVAVRIAADRKDKRLTIGLADTLLAGIAVSHGATLATRNVRHFTDLPEHLPHLAIDVVNPWGPDDPGPDA